MRNVKRLWGIIGCMAVCIVVLFSLLIARSYTQTQPPEQQPNNKQDDGKIIAKVGQREITRHELQEALGRHYGAELLNQILDREAIRLEGGESGIKIGEDQVERELKRMQQGYENEEQFYLSMKEQLGLTKEELKEDVLYKLLLEGIATKNISISDKTVDEYIRTHPDEFKTVVELNIQQIIVTTREQANKVLTELAKGTEFAILARDRSLDELTANSGGDLGWVAEDDPFVPDPILNAAKQLKAGEISKPTAVDQGFAVVRLKDRRTKPDPERPFLRENVRKELALREAPPLQDIVKKLRDKWHTVIYDPSYQK